STDPSWTPLFVNAAGLVLECGGALSHGAIVARELRLPALVLENATRTFTQGEMLTLDAGRGLIVRGAPAETSDTIRKEIPKGLHPPPVGMRERLSAKCGLMFAAAWAVLLLCFYLLPAPWLKDHIFAFLDGLLWPLVPRLGMPATVVVIAVFFGIVPLILQKYLTDNERLLAARNRAAALRRLVKNLPKEDAARQEMEKLAAPVTLRILKASMTSLAFVLGPMMLVFLWLPERLDPASWNAKSGQTISILAEVSGEWDQPITLGVPKPLEVDPPGAETKSLPLIRQTLVALRQEWAQASDTAAFPWELKATAEQVHVSMLGSLDHFLAGEIPPQKISWRIRVPEGADGHHLIRVDANKSKPATLKLAFGNAAPPAADEVFFTEGPVRSLKAIYPRALTKTQFWAPLVTGDGEPFDFGWLGVYLVAYLPTMVVLKRLLRVA
ncbi:MAG: PEP-utilizing enzyme, partial [Luteolibacter sp.]